MSSLVPCSREGCDDFTESGKKFCTWCSYIRANEGIPKFNAYEKTKTFPKNPNIAIILEKKLKFIREKKNAALKAFEDIIYQEREIELKLKSINFNESNNANYDGKYKKTVKFHIDPTEKNQ